MNRAFLRWFYVGVQFVMLAVSIPKVATLFHAYDPASLGPLVGGVDVRSWLVGVAIDLTATFTTWAAMAKYDETRKRTALIAPAAIILFCSALSVVANYEDAATQQPAAYAHLALFTQPALLINPVLISAPPVLVLLLILLVPSVLARPRLKSAAEIEAEADEQEARIRASARVRQARAEANAQVMGARLKGVVGAVAAATTHPEEPVTDRVTDRETSRETRRAFEVALPAHLSPLPAESLAGQPLPPTAKMTKAMWAAMKLSERVLQSGVITAQEVADIVGISVSHARNLLKEVPSGLQRVEGRRSGVSYSDLIDLLYGRRTKDSFAWARRLETALGVRKHPRVATEVTEVTETELPEPEPELATGT